MFMGRSGPFSYWTYMAARTGQNEGAVDLGIKELRDALIFFNRSGRAVKVEGLGT
ncbi:MAG: hypothetical protein ACOYZ6_05795 [Chloroflexota bacterium]